MLMQGQVVQSVAAARASGSPNAMQLQLGELGLSQVLPKYAALAWSGLVYTIGHSAAQALSINSTTFTGLAVANPANSGKNLVFIDAAASIAAAPANASAVVRLGYAATVALTQGNANSAKGLPVLAGSGGSSVAVCGASGTLSATPTTLRPLLGIDWVTGAQVGNLYSKDEIAGAIIIPPGQMLVMDALVAALSVVAGLTWAELPV